MISAPLVAWLVGRGRVLLALALVASGLCKSSAQDLSGKLNRPDSFFSTAEAREIGENILSYQSDWGGWPKNTDTASTPYTKDASDLHPTFDNRATTGELRFLAKLYKATKDETFLKAFERGLDYVLVAQYATGGWPQSYPPPETYHRYITFNDDSMVRIMTFLRDIYSSDSFDFLPKERREAARSSFDRGIQCILKCQVMVDGKLTVWCAQHDELDYRPRPARAFELVSLSGSESVGITRLLMTVESPSEAVVRAIEAAVEWFKKVAMDAAEAKKIGAAGKSTPLWARFYAIETNRPLFSDRDSSVKSSIDEIGEERRTGYAWVGQWPAKLLDEEYPAWKTRGRKADKNYRSTVGTFEPAVRIGIAGDLSVTDARGWAFGLKKALTNRALYLDLAGAGKDAGGTAPEAKAAGKPIAEADSPLGNPQRKRPVLSSDAWWKDVIERKPDYLLMQFDQDEESQSGEGAPKRSSPSGGGQILKMVEKARAAGIEPVLVTPPPRVRSGGSGGIDLDREPAAQTIARIAREKEVPLIDLHTLTMEGVPKLDPDVAKPLFLATAKGYSLQQPGQLTPKGKEELGALVAAEMWEVLPKLESKLGMARPAVASQLAALAPAGKAAPAALTKPPVADQEQLAREKRDALAAQRRAQEAAEKGVLIESPPVLLVIRTTDGTPRMLRAQAAVARGGVVLARMEDGTRGAWQREFVIGQMPWYPDPKSREDQKELEDLAARYESAAGRYPALRADFEAEAAALREVVSARVERERRRAEIEAKYAEVSARAYEPAKAYTNEELETILEEAEMLSGELPEKKDDLEAKMAPFRAHLERLQAGDRLVEGTWRTREDLEIEEFAADLTISADNSVLDQEQLSSALMTPALALGGLILAGVGLAFPRKTRWLGVVLFVVAGGGAALYLHMLGADSKPSKAPGTAGGDPTKVVRLFWAASKGPERPADMGETVLTSADVNAFIAKHVSFPASPPANGDVHRTDLQVDFAPGGLTISETLRKGGTLYRVRYEVAVTTGAGPGAVTLRSIKVGEAPVFGALKHALWESLTAQLGKIAQPARQAFHPVRLSRGEMAVAADGRQ